MSYASGMELNNLFRFCLFSFNKIVLFRNISFINSACSFLCIKAKKGTKEKSRQTQSLRAFCLANTPSVRLVYLIVSRFKFKHNYKRLLFFYNTFIEEPAWCTGAARASLLRYGMPSEQCQQISAPNRQEAPGC